MIIDIDRDTCVIYNKYEKATFDFHSDIQC